MKRTIYFLTVLLFLSIVSLNAGTTGSIMGFALDKDTGVPIEDAKVTVVEIGFATGTDASGMFLFAGLPVGTYSLLVEKLGYQPVSVTDIIISIDQTTTISVDLKSSPIEIKEAIIVKAEKVMINPDQTGAVTRIDHNQIVDMSSRDIFRATQIVAGVVTNEDGQMKIRGTRESNTTFLLDGLSIMDPFHNTFGSVVNAKGIMGEIDVVTGQFDAEYGNALGGVVNTVSKTPETNKYKVILTVDTAKAIPDVFGDVERYRKLGEEEYNFDIEGPVPFILNDKLGFIAAGQAFLANSSTSSGFQNDKYEDFHDYHLKLDYKISPTDRLAYHTQYGFAYIRLKFRYEAMGFSGWPIHYQFNRFHHLMYNRTITNDTYFKLALSTFDSGIDFGAHAEAPVTGEELLNEIKPMEEIGEGDYYAHQKSRVENNEIRFDLSSDHFKGHKIKVGFDIQRIHTDLLWAVFLLDPWYLDQAWFNDAYPFPVYWYLENHIHEYYQTNGYIQDKYSVMDKLMISYGLRFDYWGYIKEKNLKFQPRIGASYQLTPKTLFRANASTKYQAPPVEAVYEEDSGYSWYYGVPYDWGSDKVEPEGSKDLEIGLQQQFTDDIGIDISLYKKWLDNVVSTYYDPVTEKEAYSNVASAHVEGFELTLRKSFTSFFEGWVTYSLMSAKGENMGYRWYDQISPDDPNYGYEFYLDYDQRHTANINLTFKTEKAFVNLIWRFGSGYPYTPHFWYADDGKDGVGPDSPYYMGPDLDGSEDDGVYQEGETTDVAEQPNSDDYPGGKNDPDYKKALATYSAAVRKYWNSERYPVYARADVKVKFRLPMNWFGAQYWFNITCRNLFDHFNLRGAGGNQGGDINPYTKKKWSYATGGTSRRYTWGLELKF